MQPDLSLQHILDLPTQSWPTFIKRGGVIAHRDLVVPLTSALGVEDRSAHMLVHVLAVVRGCPCPAPFTPCNKIAGLQGRVFCRSSVVVIAQSVSEEALSPWSSSKSYRTDELDALPEWLPPTGDQSLVRYGRNVASPSLRHAKAEVLVVCILAAAPLRPAPHPSSILLVLIRVDQTVELLPRVVVSLVAILMSS